MYNNQIHNTERKPLRGRGSMSNPQCRFDSTSVEYLPGEGIAGKAATDVYADETGAILTQNDSPDVGFDLSLNPYRGCEHGCAYCYSRPNHEYLDLSAGLDFETKIFAKHRAPELLRKKLCSPRWQPQVIAMSGGTDAYQPLERELEITRRCLEVLTEARNPVAIVTKSSLVCRDIDLLQELARHNAAVVTLSITTLDADLARRMEPRTSSPQSRLEALETLSKAGIPVKVLVAPVIPGLTDEEMPAILKGSAEAGASHAGYITLRLPHGVKQLFSDWLEAHYPMRTARVLNRQRDMHGDELYDNSFHQRMTGSGHHAGLIGTAFETFCRKFGLNTGPVDLSITSFTPPDRQGSLF
jgi:DNA repair photolyase